ncbi:MAG: hypothetical protein JGK17_10195 [Microcoleus sp. PH2017_10_PVI_O_A]|uniref:hypothetical protein n=1 Tax=unclassified Microcoleus TaxID=2642155 RepID=UPI001D427E67|nr:MULTISPECIES: hypothetical protein [unclassified Microcoleus]TAE83745.1 MAG: hypothetical protein EAZ83_08495 [Oscillatoriales cyanobacterium]MCC3405942.1 hypothetical protein [Microcoleus sp. PH2017_10_PVI_O_A]MCC3459967.1 hypothetical protein [Microcoleus sp. PH2017_11_PCY_U_A]MCC3478481.1 hypothetical protein [Microcoleus sp. PH2017_12_PCY_D_A]MCC3527941.1 hypothetical protein [Microcoleus sp. PH2017_21_RUC_O_A]
MIFSQLDEYLNQEFSPESIDRILEQNPESALAWVKNTLSPQTTAPQDFNWLLLADISSAKARKGENNAGLFDRAWAEVATAIYDRLAEAAEQKKPGSGESVRISSMMLRAGAIAKYGIVPNDSVLDVNLILQWFWDNIKDSREDVEQKAANWKTLPIEEIRELRQLKNRLKVITALSKSDKYVLDEEIKTWLALREKLP